MAEAIGTCATCNHQHAGGLGLGERGECLAILDEDGTRCDCAVRWYDVLIKTIVNVKLRQVPSVDGYTGAINATEQVVDFQEVLRNSRAYDRYSDLPVYPQLACIDWGEEHTDALVDMVDPNTGEWENEDESKRYEMRAAYDDPQWEWREAEYAGNHFWVKLAELHERDQREDGFSGNDEEIAFLREMVRLAANSNTL